MKLVFFKTGSGAMPVRDWLHDFPKDERRRIGEELKVVESGWPLGMPVVKKIANVKLWEVRVNLNKRTARILFTIVGDLIVLLHGFIKKSRKIPKGDLDLAIRRMRLIF
jgi:phage-related protein